jgi:hypothetical protein
LAHQGLAIVVLTLALVQSERLVSRKVESGTAEAAKPL